MFEEDPNSYHVHSLHYSIDVKQCYVQIPTFDCLNLTAPLVKSDSPAIAPFIIFPTRAATAPRFSLCVPYLQKLTSLRLCLSSHPRAVPHLHLRKEEYYRIKRSFAGTEVDTYQEEAFLSWSKDLERREHQLNNELGQATVLGRLGHLQAVKRLTAEAQLWKDEWDERREVQKRQSLARDAKIAELRLLLKKTQEEHASRQTLLRKRRDETRASLRKTFPTADARTLERCLARLISLSSS